MKHTLDTAERAAAAKGLTLWCFRIAPQVYRYTLVRAWDGRSLVETMSWAEVFSSYRQVCDRLGIYTVPRRHGH